MQDPVRPKKARNLTNLQVLRGVAALAVVQAHTGIHYGSWHPMGSFGVDIFFVLSGFIMAMVCAPEGSQFLPKRLTRILPPYWAFTLLAYVGLVANPSLEALAPRGVLPLLKSLFFIPYPRLDGQFFPALGQGWTLNYEMCFYLLVALALLLRRRYASWIAVLLVVLLLGFARMSAAWGWSTFSGFYGNPIMLEFAAGIVSYHIYQWTQPGAVARLRPLLWATSAGAFALLCWYEGARYGTPGGPRLWMGVFAWILLQSVVLLSKAGWEIKAPWLVLIGDASYTLYLSHTFVLSPLKHLGARLGPAFQIYRPAGTLLVMAASTAVAVAVYLYVEKPLHRGLNRRLLPGGEGKALFRRV